MIVLFDVQCLDSEPKSNVDSTMITRRERFAVNACDLVAIFMNDIVNYIVDSGVRDLISGLKGISNVSH